MKHRTHSRSERSDTTVLRNPLETLIGLVIAGAWFLAGGGDWVAVFVKLAAVLSAP